MPDNPWFGMFPSFLAFYSSRALALWSALCLSALLILVYSLSYAGLEAQGKRRNTITKAPYVQRVYIGPVKGHPGEVNAFSDTLEQNLQEAGFQVVDTPEQADVSISTTLGFVNVWGEYKESRNYRVKTLVYVKTPDGRILWRHPTRKDSQCDYQCFDEMTESFTQRFYKALGESAPSQYQPEAQATSTPAPHRKLRELRPLR